MLKIWALLIAVLMVLLILHILKLSWSSRSYPPGPLRLPIIGSCWKLGVKVTEDLFLKMAKQYGNIFSVWIGPIHVIVVSGYEAVNEVLVKHSEEFVNRPISPFINLLSKKKGIIMSNGHTWKQQRKFGLVTMRKLGLGKKGMEQQIQEEAHLLVETLARAKGQPIDPSLHIKNSVTNVVSALAFGHRFSMEDKEFITLIDLIDKCVKFTGTSINYLAEIFPGVMEWLPGPHKRVLAGVEIVRGFVMKEIEKHKEYQAMHDPQDFIDFYLLQMEKSKNDPNTTYNEENLVHCIFDFFLAGSETSATALEWALLLMANHPDIQQKVQKEMEDAFGSSQSLSYQDRKRLPYTCAVIHEILRAHYVLLAGIHREPMKDVNIFGFLIPKGTHVLPDLRSALRDPTQWETPQEFNPNHFLDKDGNFVTREAFIPFGAGARACLGEQLANIELFIFFTSLLRALTFQPPEGVKELSTEPVAGVSVHPSTYKVCAVPCRHISENRKVLDSTISRRYSSD